MSEHDEQKTLFSWAAYANGRFPELKLMFAIPNGGHRHKAVASKMKAEGVKAGVPDIFLPAPRGGYHGLFIEMKYGRNKASQPQLRWIDALAAAGYLAIICYGFEDAQENIISYLEMETES